MVSERYIEKRTNTHRDHNVGKRNLAPTRDAQPLQDSHLVHLSQRRELSVDELEVGPPVRPFLRAPEHHGYVVLRSRKSCLSG